jgi:YD repeat-containing protein
VAGNRISQTDANNHTTTYAFDVLNRRTSRTLPLGQSESFIYDPVGNVATRTDFNGHTTTNAYDSLNRLLRRTPDAFFIGAPVESFTYTATGQRASMLDALGATNYTYSNRDQILTKVTSQGTLTYTYDVSANVASVISSNASGTNVTYAWDVNNRLSSVTDNHTSGVTNYTYDTTNQLASFTYPNGVSHVVTYDSRDRTTALNVNGSSGAIATYAQTFGFSGRKLTVSELNGRSENYSYDSIYRLLNETIASDPISANNGGLGYSLDSVGNRQSLNSTLAALQSQSFAYDANDRLNLDTYDANGNTLTSGGATYSYDFQDRLISTSTGVQIAYDGDGNRVSETASGATTKFLKRRNSSLTRKHRSVTLKSPRSWSAGQSRPNLHTVQCVSRRTVAER